MLGRVVVGREEDVEVVGDLGGRFGPLGAVLGGERFRRGDRMVLVFGGVDLGEGLLRVRVGRLRQRVEHVADLVDLMPNSA